MPPYSTELLIKKNLNCDCSPINQPYGALVKISHAIKRSHFCLVFSPPGYQDSSFLYIGPFDICFAKCNSMYMYLPLLPEDSSNFPWIQTMLLTKSFEFHQKCIHACYMINKCNSFASSGNELTHPLLCIPIIYVL